MAAIDDLIAQIADESLRERIRAEFKRANKQKKFGLVYEEHLPEATPLYDVPVKKGSVVAKKNGEITDLLYVEAIADEQATCISKATKDHAVYPVSTLVSVAQFGEPIYPYLKPIDTVCNAPDSDLWHTLIEADNYHALQLLVYLYAGKVDCIYIDPPYNTGARDWKYNNDYVDGADTYRHSKWLSFMEKRLKLAKKLLNPSDSVLIVTIDEKEYLHLGCLLEEIFPEARIQMVSVAIHAAGVSRSEFSRTDEYYFFVFIGSASPKAVVMGAEWQNGAKKRQSDVRWESMLRSGDGGRRTDRPNLFFPALFDPTTGNLIGFDQPVPLGISGNEYKAPPGTVAVLPYAQDGTEARWRISAQKANELREIGALDWSYKGEKSTLRYLKPGELGKIETGEYRVVGHKENGAMILDADGYQPKWVPGTQWNVSTHEAGMGGSSLIKAILGDKRFDYPKSLYAVRDAIKFMTADKPNALIVDFFSGSGTTLHAVNLLNAEDDGHRRCIMVTNNEVSVEEAKLLVTQGKQPGDLEWERLGIARYVTWPRTVCSIEGHDINGHPLKGTYLGGSLENPRSMAEGFAANAVFFKLGFLDKTAVALGRQFKELLPVLWLKAGAYGPCPTNDSAEAPAMLVLPENHFAVLTDEAQFESFAMQANADNRIETVYIVTDSEAGYREMLGGLKAENTFQLYRDYLDNFRINQGGR